MSLFRYRTTREKRKQQNYKTIKQQTYEHKIFKLYKIIRGMNPFVFQTKWNITQIIIYPILDFFTPKFISTFLKYLSFREKIGQISVD